MVYGEGRGVAVCDYDGDGRVDVCVGQNGAKAKLYHNERARPGLRVRLSGPEKNPNALGAVLRAGFANGQFGPARQIHAGHGWLSQDSAVSLLTGAKTIDSIQVRWPNGKVTISKVPSGAGEVEIGPGGGIKVLR